MPTMPVARISRPRIAGLALLLAALSAGWAVFAQRPGRGGGPDRFTSRTGGSRLASNSDPRRGVPEWQVNESFKADVFTFARLRYRSSGRGGWRNDWPAADLNLSYRLNQLTSMHVDPEAAVVDIDDPRLFELPFVFMSDPRSLDLNDEEAAILRRYLTNGGFIMVDDFWGQRMWDHLFEEFKKVFPNPQWVSLPGDHPIFNVPYKLPYKPQVPSEDSAHATKDLTGPERTWEMEIKWEPPQPPDYRAFVDEKGRILMLVCLNTDLGDGWEEEGISQWFFETYAEKLSYPMGINILFHTMTH